MLSRFRLVDSVVVVVFAVETKLDAAELEKMNEIKHKPSKATAAKDPAAPNMAVHMVFRKGKV